MRCKKCGSENVTIQVVTEQELKEKKKGLIWWCCIGWLWVPIKWVIFTIPALIIHIFKPKSYKTVIKQKKIAVCHDCGKSWNI